MPRLKPKPRQAAATLPARPPPRRSRACPPASLPIRPHARLPECLPALSAAGLPSEWNHWSYTSLPGSTGSDFTVSVASPRSFRTAMAASKAASGAAPPSAAEESQDSSSGAAPVRYGHSSPAPARGSAPAAGEPAQPRRVCAADGCRETVRWVQGSAVSFVMCTRVQQVTRHASHCCKASLE